MPSGSYLRCHDQVTALDFEYPSSWGQITAQLHAGYYAGYGYFYVFSAANTDVGACGNSREYSDPVGGCFNGFHPDKSGAVVICPEAQFAPICQQLRTNIYFIVEMPYSGAICEPGGPVLTEPRASVEINLPQDDKISGFVFSSNILSQRLSSELASILSIGPNYSTYATQQARCQDTAFRQQFDARVKHIIDAIKAGTADSETQANIAQLMRLAQSIRVD